MSSSTSSYITDSTKSTTHITNSNNNNIQIKNFQISESSDANFALFQKSPPYSKMNYELTDFISMTGSIGKITPPPMFAQQPTDLRYCFSIRNSMSNNASSSTVSSSEIYSDLEEKRLIKSKGLICVTDGISTSFKVLNNKNKSSACNNQFLNCNHQLIAKKYESCMILNFFVSY